MLPSSLPLLHLLFPPSFSSFPSSHLPFLLFFLRLPPLRPFSSIPSLLHFFIRPFHPSLFGSFFTPCLPPSLPHSYLLSLLFSPLTFPSSFPLYLSPFLRSSVFPFLPHSHHLSHFPSFTLFLPPSTLYFILPFHLHSLHLSIPSPSVLFLTHSSFSLYFSLPSQLPNSPFDPFLLCPPPFSLRPSFLPSATKISASTPNIFMAHEGGGAEGEGRG